MELSRRQGKACGIRCGSGLGSTVEAFTIFGALRGLFHDSSTRLVSASFLDSGTQCAPDRADPPIHAGRGRGARLRSAEQILSGDQPSAAGRGRSYPLITLSPLLSVT